MLGMNFDGRRLSLYTVPLRLHTHMFLSFSKSHAMGNSNGNLHRYWNAFGDKDLPRLQGGFIWDMVDQGIRTANKVSLIYKHNLK